MAQGLPVVTLEELDVQTIRDAILTHGCLHVKGFLSEDLIAEFKAGIDETFTACEAQEARKTAAPQNGGARRATNGDGQRTSPPGTSRSSRWRPTRSGGGRDWNKNNTGDLGGPPPRVHVELVEAFERAGSRADHRLPRRAAGDLDEQERRCAASADRGGAEWHQDGAFLGESIRSLNVWLALTQCGEDAPGLEVVSHAARRDRRRPAARAPTSTGPSAPRSSSGSRARPEASRTGLPGRRRDALRSPDSCTGPGRSRGDDRKSATRSRPGSSRPRATRTNRYHSSIECGVKRVSVVLMTYAERDSIRSVIDGF